MKILCLFGSPRPNGYSAQLLCAFCDALPAGSECVPVDFYALSPRPCTACGVCRTRDGCAFEDLDAADTLLREADAAVWALPVYNDSVPAPVKAFFDRCQRYYEAAVVRGENVFGNRARPCVLLLTAGSADGHSLAVVQRQLRVVCASTGFRLTETVFANRTDADGLSQVFLEEARRIAKGMGAGIAGA